MLFDSNTFSPEDLNDLKPKLSQGNYELTIHSFTFVSNEKGGYFSIKGTAKDENGHEYAWNDGVINGNNKKGFNFLLRNLHVQCDPEGDWSIPSTAKGQKEWLSMVQSKVQGHTFKVSVERGDYLNKFYYPNGYERDIENDDEAVVE